jgi:hypothetical protein
VALGVVGGYVLGRTKKMKFAMMLGGVAAGRRAGGPGQLLAQGTKLLGQTPELARLTDEIRGRLVDAGKGAAVAVATRQVENLAERVLSRAGTLADTGGKTVSDVGDAAGGIVTGVGKTVGGLGRRQSRDVESDEEYDEGLAETANEELADASGASDRESSEDAGGEPTDLEDPVEDTQGGPAEGDEDEEASASRRQPAHAGAAGAEGAALKRAGSAARGAAGRAGAGRGGRGTRGRQERGNG